MELRIAEVNREAIAFQSDTARRLMTIPGIGPLAARALLAAAGSARQFKEARDMAARVLFPENTLRERNEAVGNKQARQPISAPDDHPWRPLLRDTP